MLRLTDGFLQANFARVKVQTLFDTIKDIIVTPINVKCAIDTCDRCDAILSSNIRLKTHVYNEPI